MENFFTQNNVIVRESDMLSIRERILESNKNVVVCGVMFLCLWLMCDCQNVAGRSTEREYMSESVLDGGEEKKSSLESMEQEQDPEREVIQEHVFDGSLVPDGLCIRKIRCQGDNDCRDGRVCRLGLCMIQEEICGQGRDCSCMVGAEADPQCPGRSYCVQGQCWSVQCQDDCDCIVGLTHERDQVGVVCGPQGFCSTCTEVCVNDGNCGFYKVCHQFGGIRIRGQPGCSHCIADKAP